MWTGDLQGGQGRCETVAPGSKTVAHGLERTNAVTMTLTHEGDDGFVTASAATISSTVTSCARRRMGEATGGAKGTTTTMSSYRGGQAGSA
jgi:hypothetical protein